MIPDNMFSTLKYNAIQETTAVNRTEITTPVISRFEQGKQTCGDYLAWLALGCAALVLLYICSVLIGIFIVIFNTLFEATIVHIFGRDLYNKNFPVCTDTRYVGNDCYTTTNTYCS